MNHSTNSLSPNAGTTSATAPAESELQQLGRLLDDFFANIAL